MDWSLDLLQPLLALAEHEALTAALFFGLTAVLVALCVPGVLIPLTLGSAALLGPVPAAAAVLLGALAGSQLLFVVTRHLIGERVRARLGSRLSWFEQKFEAHGSWYVVVLRIVGAPHFLVTAGSALMPMRARVFAAATALGLLPVISLAAATGSAL